MFAVMDTPPIFPTQASKFAEQYDVLFYYITAVCILGGGAVYGLLTYCCFKFAKREGVAEIFIASHGRHGLARLAMGSVSTRVVEWAPCTVTVVK